MVPFCRRITPAALLAGVLLTAWVGIAQAQQRPFAYMVDDWKQSLDLASQELLQPSLPEDRTDALRVTLSRVRSEAAEVKAAAEAALGPLRGKLNALGPPPGEDEPAEFEAITTERRNITDAIALQEGRIKQADLTVRRVEDLATELRSRSIDMMVEHLLLGFPYPLAPETLGTALPDLFARLGALAASPWTWWRDLSPSQLDESHLYALLVILALALVAALILRRIALRRFGRDAAVEAPRYSRRFYGGLAEGIANGIVPAVILAAVWARVSFGPLFGAEVITGDFAEAIRFGSLAGIFFFLARAMSRAVLAPELPAWRLVPLLPHNARRIGMVITALAGIAALDFWLAQTLDIAGESETVQSFYLTLASLLEAGGVLFLAQGPLWRVDPTFDRAATGPKGEAKPEPRRAMARLWQIIRIAAGLIALATLGSALLGYANLAAYLAKALLLSGLLLGGLFLLRGLFREFIGVALRSRFARDTLEFQHATRQLLKFWLRILLDVFLIAAGAILVLPMWGVPLSEIWTWTWEILQGITVGNVTVSITDILAALLVFALAVVLTRILQRVLSDKVLPKISGDTGVQHSLSAGFGYLAFAGLAGEMAAKDGPSEHRSIRAPKPAHFAARAKRIIFLCMNGGPSHVDLFDYKPALNKQSGEFKTVGRGRGRLRTSRACRWRPSRPHRAASRH